MPAQAIAIEQERLAGFDVCPQHKRWAVESLAVGEAVSCIAFAIRWCAISTYEALSSMPMYCLPSRFATTAVVPDPRNGSSTVPSGGHPACKGVSTSSWGYTAKCASGYDVVEIAQTERM